MMMDTPLNAWLLFDHSPNHAPDARAGQPLPVGPRGAADLRRVRPPHPTADARPRSSRPRDRATAWPPWPGTARDHLEAYFGVPCTGRVLHTLNLRVSPEELAFMLKDADDRAVLVDPDLLPLLEQALAARHPRRPTSSSSATTCPRRRSPASSPTRTSSPTSRRTTRAARSTSVSRWGSATPRGPPGGPRASSTPIAPRSSTPWPSPPTPACPSGRAMPCCPQVPMFHANAWGMPYAAAAVGAKQVFFAGALDPSAFVDLLRDERVTVPPGCPRCGSASPTSWPGAAETLARPPPHRLRRRPAAPLHDRALRRPSSASASCRPGV